MLFNSFHFLLFFPIVVLIYFVIPKKTRYIWLLFASYYFYMSWNAKYALLIALSTGITWVSGLLLEKASSIRQKKWTVALSFLSNLGILFFFKYFDFAINNLNRILSHMGLELINNPFDIVLPVGISFYTFQALSYTMDVYRGEIAAEKNPLRYALFVSFFPQLVAGPIERSENLLSQLKEIDHKKVFHYESIVSGLYMMIWGLFQKMVIADRISIMVDHVFENAYAYGTFELFLAALGFAIQIYCDFNGYSTIAIGAARVMGFSLMDNFNTPYFATSISDFWHRWHISLSTWFRDYLYIPLGGNRCSKFKKYRNIMITFLTSGLWHGASWSFVVWGGLHGLYQIIGDILKPVKQKLIRFGKVNTDNFSYRFGQIVVTFFLTTITWIFFRAGSLAEALYFIRRLFTKWNPWVLFDESLYTLGLDRVEANILIVSVVVLLLVDLLKYCRNMEFSAFLMKQNLWFRWLAALALIVAVLVYGEYGVNFDSAQFIYFNF